MVVAQQPQAVPQGRWDTVTMDWVTGLPLTKDGFDAILGVTDVTTGRVRLLKARADDTARVSAQRFLEGVFCLHGMPRRIVSDRDPKIISEFWQQLMTLLGTELALSTASHPQTDGRSERTNQSVENVLRAFVDYNQADWAEKLFAAEFALNSHVNASSGVAPFVLDLGRLPATPAALWRQELAGAAVESVASGLPEAQGAQAVVDRVASAISHARDQIALKQADTVAQKLGGASVSKPLVIGDQVFVKREAARDPTVDDAGVAKLLPRFIGPFRVEQVLGPATVRLLLPPQIKCHPVFNVEHLKRAVESPPEFAERKKPAPGPVARDGRGHELFEVEEIVDKKYLRRKLLYLVRWTGYDELSWEPASSLNAPRVKVLVSEFLQRYQPPRSKRIMRQRVGPGGEGV